MGLSQKIK